MKEFKKTKNIHPCLLEKKDVLRLEEILKEGFESQKAVFTVELKLQKTHFSENSIFELLKHEELPDSIDNLSFWFHSQTLLENGELGQDKRYVSLDFGSASISISVGGASSEWVAGKYDRVLEFLYNKRPWYRFFGGEINFNLALILSWPVFILTISNLANVYYGNFELVWVQILFLLSLVATISSCSHYFTPYTRIILIDTLLRQEWYEKWWMKNLVFPLLVILVGTMFSWVLFEI